MIRDSNSDVRIDPFPGVRQIAPKIQQIHSLVGVSNSTKFREKWLVTV